MKKILILVFLLYSCSVTIADDYVSPESYAVNDDEIRALYQELMQPAQQTQQPIQNIQYNPDEDSEKGVRATLRRIRYKTLNPYHGVKHQIKIDATRKFEQGS